MSMHSLDTIYTGFRASFRDTPEFAISYYREHAAFLNNIRTFSTPAELKYFTELSWHYINALYAKDHYNEAIDEAKDRLFLIDTYIDATSRPDLKDTWYQGILFIMAMSLYRLRDYGKAASLFTSLRLIDPGNDLYLKWQSDALYGKRLRLINMIWAASAVLLVFVLFFEEFIHPPLLKLSLTVAGFTGIIGNLVYEHWTKRSLRRKPEPAPRSTVK